MPSQPPPANPHFEPLADWGAAEARLGWAPRVPRETAGYRLAGLRLFVRDHRGREVSPDRQSLEAHYGGFSFSQLRSDSAAARRAALETAYGSAPRAVDVGGREARACDAGPEPEADDSDPRMPAVVVWAEAERFHLLASEQLPVETLLAIARSLA